MLRRLVEPKYYTCFSVNRYGKGHCGAERLPADQLETAVLDALLEVFADLDLVTRAVEAAANRREEDDQHLRDELNAVTRELAATEESIDRYLTAFETGSLPQSVCTPRVQALADREAQLTQRCADLERDLARENRTVPDGEELAEMRAALREAVSDGKPAVVKALLEGLVHDITVEGRHRIVPTFRLPESAETPDHGSNVGAMGGSVPPTCHHAKTEVLIAAPSISLPPTHAKVRRTGYRLRRCLTW